MALAVVSGGTVLPGRKLATGGQGEIFAVASPAGFVLKRYLRRTLDGDPALARAAGGHGRSPARRVA